MLIRVFKILADGEIGVNKLPHSGQFLIWRYHRDFPFAHRPVNDPGQMLDHVLGGHFSPSGLCVGREFSEQAV